MYFFFNMRLYKFFSYYLGGSLAESKPFYGDCPCPNKDKLLSVYYGPNFKCIAVFILILFGTAFHTLIEYNNTETLLFSSFILVFFTIVFIIYDGFLDLRADFFFNILDTFAFSYRLKSRKVNRLRVSYFNNDLNLFYKMDASIFVASFFKKFNLDKDFLFEEDSAIFHNFFFFDFFREVTNNTHW